MTERTLLEEEWRSWSPHSIVEKGYPYIYKGDSIYFKIDPYGYVYDKK